MRNGGHVSASSRASTMVLTNPIALMAARAPVIQALPAIIRATTLDNVDVSGRG